MDGIVAIYKVGSLRVHIYVRKDARACCRFERECGGFLLLSLFSTPDFAIAPSIPLPLPPTSLSLSLPSPSRTVINPIISINTITANPTPQLRRLIPIIIALIPRANGTHAVRARAGNGRLVAVVGVDAGEELAVDGPDARHGDGARVLRAAVTAAAVDLAEVLGVEVLDGHGSGAVVLDDLVGRFEGAAADDVRGAG